MNRRRPSPRTRLAFVATFVVALGCGVSTVQPTRTPSPAQTIAPPPPTAEAKPSTAEPPPPLRLPRAGARAVRDEAGMVSSEDALASRVGAEVLVFGGNAVDAAVAVAFALAVTNPVAGALGGGGFLVVRTPEGKVHALDFREEAPALATPEGLARAQRKSAHGYASAPVPGLVAGLTLARERFGTRPLAELIAPAVRLAERGHPLNPRQAKVLGWFWREFRDRPLRALLGRGKKPLREGDTLRQPELARTLRAIAERGNDGFYRGGVAAAIARAMKANGGLVTEEDLARYQAKERPPLRTEFRGLEIWTMPPPSMGGVALVGILGHLATRPPLAPDAADAAHEHALVEAARRAYADRRSIGADPDTQNRGHYDHMLAELLGATYHTARKPSFDPERATPSDSVVPIAEEREAPESTETTHLSVVDGRGMAVALTLTLSGAFGARVLVPDTGILLSNAMGGFSPSGINVVAQGKRMASSMSPTLVVGAGKTVAVLGSPGGDTIPNTVATVLVNLVDRDMPLEDAIEAPRLHHQHRPDRIRYERHRPPSDGVLAALMRRGHELRPGPDQGAANCIVVDPVTGTSFGHADSRKGGLAIGPKGVLAGTYGFPER